MWCGSVSVGGDGVSDRYAEAVFADADLILCRSGASTVAELAAAGKAGGAGAFADGCG